jgi:hypothetical protein
LYFLKTILYSHSIKKSTKIELYVFCGRLTPPYGAPFLRRLECVT